MKNTRGFEKGEKTLNNVEKLQRVEIEITRENDGWCWEIHTSEEGEKEEKEQWRMGIFGPIPYS